MNYSYPQVVVSEIPGEITLALSISGCPLRCIGCHSTETYDPKFGKELTIEELENLLKKYKHISCILFYGGEWFGKELIDIIRYIRRKKDIKVALYSGLEIEFIHDDIINELDFLKVGPYKKEHGGLDNINTNQRFYTIQNNELLDTTHLFH